MSESALFYETLPHRTDFAAMADPAQFAELPGDWWVGVSDIEGSTQLVAEGKYKTVNMVGAAVISAVMNVLDGRSFPFVFGGDGASFAVWPAAEGVVREALAAVARWADTEFGITLRVALVPVAECVAAGHPVRLARFQAAPEAHYAMFAGGGLSWSEAQMKAGHYAIPVAPEGAVPDLTGLSCRWSPMVARADTILSLVVVPEEEIDARAFASVAAQVIDIAYPLDREGHPAPAAGPGSAWPPPGATLEAHAQRGTSSVAKARRKVLVETFIAWLLVKTGIKLAGFDARRYARVVGENADFRKFDDGLKMTIDCDFATRDKILTVLESAQDAGVLRFGASEQSEAMMTCIVPDFMRDDHVHFIDGAAGGYTLAASRMKAR